MLITNTNLTISVKDMQQSIAFYQALGLSLKNRWGDHYAQLTAPGLVIGLHPQGEKEAAPGSGNVSVGFTTENLEETKTHLQNLNIPIEERHEEGGEFLHFQDPDGTALYFIKTRW